MQVLWQKSISNSWEEWTLNGKKSFFLKQIWDMTLFGKSSRFDQIYFGILLLGQLLIHLALQTTAENLIFQKQGMFLPILILSILILFQRKFLFSFSTARENTVCCLVVFPRKPTSHRDWAGDVGFDCRPLHQRKSRRRLLSLYPTPIPPSNN